MVPVENPSCCRDPLQVYGYYFFVMPDERLSSIDDSPRIRASGNSACALIEDDETRVMVVLEDDYLVTCRNGGGVARRTWPIRAGATSPTRRYSNCRCSGTRC